MKLCILNTTEILGEIAVVASCNNTKGGGCCREG